MATLRTAVAYALAACGALLLSPALLQLVRLVYCGFALLYCKLHLGPGEHYWVAAGTAATLNIKDGTPTPIPKIIHQIWLSPDPTIPDRWKDAHRSCQEHHHGWEKRLWSEADARAFVAANYSSFLPTYNSYPHRVQRVDALRYMVLLTYGGIYLDLDVGCRMPLDPLRQYQLVLASTEPFGFANDIIAAAPNHPLMQVAVHELPAWNKRYGTTYPTVMFSTGPMFLNLLYTRHPEVTTGIRVLPTHLYDGGWASFLDHYDGNSWHAADSTLVYFVYNNLAVLLVVLGVLAGCAALAALWCYHKRRRGKNCSCDKSCDKRVS